MDALQFVFLIGVLLSIVLQVIMFPGTVIQFGLILLYSILTGFETVSHWNMAFFAVLTLVSGLIDNIANLLGAKKFGSSKWGIFGAFLGGILSIISFQFWTALVFPFIGAVLFEIVFDEREWKAAMKSGIGSWIGFLSGYFLKVIIAVVNAIAFLIIISS